MFQLYYEEISLPNHKSIIMYLPYFTAAFSLCHIESLKSENHVTKLLNNIDNVTILFFKPLILVHVERRALFF